MTADKPRRQVFRQEIRDRIRDAIFSGELKPGDRIIETFWAKELGVSQGPVREAIRDLEALGLVETIPFKGSRVRKLSRKDVIDNYEVRICLESKSIRDAIQILSDTDLANLSDHLQQVLHEMDRCAEQADLIHFTESDAAFHQSIIDATGNVVLKRLWKQCNMRNWFTVSKLADADNLKRLQKEHQRILNAIRVRDIEEATITLEEHLTNLMMSFMDD